MTAVPSLFETEMRSQIANAESAVLEAVNSGDPILVEIASNQLDDLIALAHRNGLQIVPNVPSDASVRTDEIDLTTTEARSA